MNISYYGVYQNKIVKATNKCILNNENITEKVKYTLSLSIRDTLGKDVSIKIN